MMRIAGFGEYNELKSATISSLLLANPRIAVYSFFLSIYDSSLLILRLRRKHKLQGFRWQEKSAGISPDAFSSTVIL